MTCQYCSTRPEIISILFLLLLVIKPGMKLLKEFIALDSIYNSMMKRKDTLNFGL